MNAQPTAFDAPGAARDKTPRTRSVPRLALTPAEAAESIGMSADTFDRYVRDELRWVRCGSKKVVPIAELERWLDENARRVVES